MLIAFLSPFPESPCPVPCSLGFSLLLGGAVPFQNHIKSIESYGESIVDSVTGTTNQISLTIQAAAMSSIAGHTLPSEWMKKRNVASLSEPC